MSDNSSSTPNEPELTDAEKLGVALQALVVMAELIGTIEDAMRKTEIVFDHLSKAMGSSVAPTPERSRIIKL